MTIPEELIFEQFIIGEMGNFAYFIGCKNTKEVAIVDPGWDADLILKKSEDMGYIIVAILLTHDHYDHAGAVHNVLRLTGGNIPIYVSSKGSSMAEKNIDNIVLCDNDQEIRIGSIDLKCLSTPGHTIDSQCFLYKNVLITGDTLFIGGCGRTDLPGGNSGELYESLYNVIMKLSDNIIVYPGHEYGPSSFDSIGNQKKTNHFLTCSSKEEFLTERM